VHFSNLNTIWLSQEEERMMAAAALGNGDASGAKQISRPAPLILPGRQRGLRKYMYFCWLG